MRVEQLKVVINCFLMQTYKSKELVVVYEDDDKAMCEFVMDWKGLDSVKFYKVSVIPEKRTLGWLRNFSLQKATGKYVMQWDDDDWYMANRIEIMLESLLKSKRLSLFLKQWLIYDKVRGKLLLSPMRRWEGSIIAYKAFLVQLGGYANLKKMEDNMLLHKIDGCRNFALLDAPWLYIYVIHGENTWELEHFKTFTDNGTVMDSKWLKICENLVNGKVSCVEGTVILNKMGNFLGENGVYNIIT